MTATGTRLTGKSGLVGYFDAPPGKPTVYEFVRYMEPQTTIMMLPYGLVNASTVHKVGAEKWDGPGLAVQYIEVEGPLNPTWPPESHRRIFGDLAQKTFRDHNYGDRVEVVSDRPLVDAERILKAFTRRAFRRTVTADDVAPFVAIVQAKLAEGYTFEPAMRAALKGVLISPEFLFLREQPGKLDDFALASRLSYFLWSTMPDDELFTLAEQQKLSRPDVLRQQVERLLASPKAAAFTENFVGQWLGLREIDATEPSHILYPEFDHLLKVSMIRETELFFDEVLKNDLSLTNFVASDFTMLNGRLAKHYGIPGVDGWEFQKKHAAAGQPSGRRVDDGQRAQGDGQRHDDLAGAARGVGPGSHPGHAAAAAARQRAGDRPRHSRRQDDPRAAGQAPLDRVVWRVPSQDRSPRICPGELRLHRRLARQLPRHRAGRERHRSTAGGCRISRARKWTPPTSRPTASGSRTSTSSSRFSCEDKPRLARALTTKLITYATGRAPQASDRDGGRGDRRQDRAPRIMDCGR